MNKMQYDVWACFTQAFGRTPLKQRLDDILGEAIELHRFSDIPNLKEELGDLLASALMLACEMGENAETLVDATLAKIQRRQSQYKSLGRKTKVAIMGGAFDPPTLGHFQVAQFVLNTSKEFDEVWLMPCYQHMFGKKMLPPEERLSMCDLLHNYDARIKIFSYEIENQFQGETYQLVKRLLDEDYAKHQYDFSLIIGMDNALCFDKWVNYELLERMIRFVVVPRKGYSLEQAKGVDWFLKPPHIYLGSCENPIAETSSTEVRNRLLSGKPIGDLVLPEVEKYIREYKLYIDQLEQEE